MPPRNRLDLSRIPRAPEPEPEPEEGFGRTDAAALAIRAGSGLFGASGGAPGAIAGGVGEGLAQLVEFLGGKKGPDAMGRLARIGTEAGLGLIPASRISKPFRLAGNFVRSGALAGGGDLARQAAAKETLDPRELDYSRAALTGLAGGVLGAGAQKGIEKIFPNFAKAQAEAAEAAAKAKAPKDAGLTVTNNAGRPVVRAERGRAEIADLPKPAATGPAPKANPAKRRVGNLADDFGAQLEAEATDPAIAARRGDARRVAYNTPQAPSKSSVREGKEIDKLQELFSGAMAKRDKTYTGEVEEELSGQFDRAMRTRDSGFKAEQDAAAAELKALSDQFDRAMKVRDSGFAAEEDVRNKLGAMHLQSIDDEAAAAKIAAAKIGLEEMPPTVTETAKLKVPGGTETATRRFKTPEAPDGADLPFGTPPAGAPPPPTGMSPTPPRPKLPEATRAGKFLEFDDPLTSLDTWYKTLSDEARAGGRFPKELQSLIGRALGGAKKRAGLDTKAPIPGTPVPPKAPPPVGTADLPEDAAALDISSPFYEAAAKAEAAKAGRSFGADADAEQLKILQDFLAGQPGAKTATAPVAGPQSIDDIRKALGKGNPPPEVPPAAAVVPQPKGPKGPPPPPAAAAVPIEAPTAAPVDAVAKLTKKLPKPKSQAAEPVAPVDPVSRDLRLSPHDTERLRAGIGKGPASSEGRHSVKIGKRFFAPHGFNPKGTLDNAEDFVGAAELIPEAQWKTYKSTGNPSIHYGKKVKTPHGTMYIADEIRAIGTGAKDTKLPKLPPAEPPTAGAAPVKAPKAPKGPAPAAPAMAVPEAAARALRTVDLAGARTGKDVQQRVLDTLGQELERTKAAGNALEIVPQKNPRNFTVMHNGQPLVDVQDGVMRVAYGADPEAMAKLTKLTPDSGRTAKDAGYRGPSGAKVSLGGVPGIARVKNSSPADIQEAARMHIGRLLGGEGKQVDIQIPGATKYTIADNPEAFGKFIERVKQGGVAPWKDLKGQKGALVNELALATAMGTAGAFGGAAYGSSEGYDPVASGLAGAALGFGAPYAVSKGGMSMPDLSGVPGQIKEALGSRANISDTVASTLEKIPQIQRSNLLMSPEGLLANAHVGPWGSTVVAGLELALKGDPRGTEILKKAWNPVAFGKKMWDNRSEAERLVAQGELGRSEGLDEGAIDTAARAYLAVPATAMTAGDITGTGITQGEGLAEDLARKYALTSEPTGMFHSIANWGRGKPINDADRAVKALLNTMMPFRRTPVNILEQGLERFPAIGAGYKALKYKGDVDLQDLVVEQGMGAAAMGGGYLAGDNVDPETARNVKRYLTNAAGVYSLPTSVGFALGQGHQKGQSGKQTAAGIGKDMFPLPADQPVRDLANLAIDGTVPRGALPSWIYDMVKENNAEVPQDVIPELPTIERLRGSRRRGGF